MAFFQTVPSSGFGHLYLAQSSRRFPGDAFATWPGLHAGKPAQTSGQNLHWLCSARNSSRHRGDVITRKLDFDGAGIAGLFWRVALSTDTPVAVVGVADATDRRRLL